MDEYGSRIVATRRSQPKRAGSSKTVGRTRDKKFSEESQGGSLDELNSVGCVS